MSRPRKPTAILELSGAYKKDPARAIGRVNEPQPKGEIGQPPASFGEELAALWMEIVSECAPGVAKLSDRKAMEGFCRVTLRCRRGDATAADFALLKAYAQQFGMTPAARSLVNVPQDENDNEFARAAAEIAAIRADRSEVSTG